ncbi:MAG TPA: carbohydrate-binding protein [Planctomycetota bacterium]|nr:carbohydrate-binding protein [Planctomycetota bacterium]HRR79128.1 carbohydrate-binding protein [Planctomycetota bacterium]HRT95973.1 carbohydrate-binding protein [Planctomycetota bacterium]
MRARGIFVAALAAAAAWAGEAARSVGIEVLDAAGAVVAQRAASADGIATLAFEREFAKGDRVRITGPKHLVVRLNEKMPQCLVYAPQGVVEYPIPSGTERRVYPPEQFAGVRHSAMARPAAAEDLATYRNVAFNPYDVRGTSTFFPHATSNSECRNEPDFAARNAIDGLSKNKGHGPWPHQSWGPDRRADLWWKVEFGRPVEVDKLVLHIRADFPHDRHWHAATVEFSDGSREKIEIRKQAEPQTFEFTKRAVAWLQLTDLMQQPPLGWCALTEVEVWGKDAPPASVQ